MQVFKIIKFQNPLNYQTSLMFESLTFISTVEITNLTPENHKQYYYWINIHNKTSGYWQKVEMIFLS